MMNMEFKDLRRNKPERLLEDLGMGVAFLWGDSILITGDEGCFCPETGDLWPWSDLEPERMWVVPIYNFEIVIPAEEEETTEEEEW